MYLRKGVDCLFLHLFKCLTLKKFLKILWRFLLVIFLLILALLIFVETPSGQNWLGRQFTKKFSRELNTRIEIKRVSFSLFNKLNLEDFMLEDQQHDTLLFARKLELRITDWFFFKNKIDFKYFGLENAVVKLQKTDTLWNYQFLVNYFTPTSKNPKKQSAIQFDLKKISLKNVIVVQKDAWRGQDIVASVGDLEMDANEISLSKKNIDITSLDLTQPLFSLYTYPGKSTSAPKKDTIVVHPKTLSDTLLLWNPGGWTMNIASVKIANGVFKNIKKNDKAVLSYFDPKDMEFTAINGQFNNIKLDKDTFSAKVNMSTKERSGFKVKSFVSDVKINPKAMVFDHLDLQTNNSRLRDHFAMSYNDMGDMADFVDKVRMQANFDNAEIDSDDLAYFAPALKAWDRKIRISGSFRGTIDDLSGRNLVINAGNSTYVNGDISLTGLPNIDQTFIDFKSNDTRTNYSDVIRFVPAVRKITQPDLARLGNIHFTGSFTGFIRDFVTFGTIRTNLGSVTTDLNMKLPPGGEPIYSGNIATTGFRLGEFIHDPKIGLVSFSGVVKGHGSTTNTLGVDVKANIQEFDYNGYRYKNIITNGKLEKHLFNGFASIDDPNLKATLNGLVDINADLSKFDLVADVQKANLQALKFTPEDISFNGKFNLNFTGNNIDNFLGIARINQANLVRNGHRLSLDSLVLHSEYMNGLRTLTARSNEFDGSITGDFNIDDLPNAIQLFLNKYYPSYINAPSQVITHQNFKFSLVTRDVDQFVQLIDKNLKGFNDSKLEGFLDLAQNQLEFTADVPQFIYKDKYVFSNTNIQGKGTLSQLALNGNILNVTMNDTINLPNTSFSVVARHDSSDIKISTEANQAVTKVNLAASVITYNDGVKINFDTSSFVLNTKTWTIDKGGELTFRKNTKASGEVVLRESNQEIRLRTVPSTGSSWNDLLVNLKTVNIGDIAPYFIPNMRLEGLLSGSGKIENPGPKMVATGDFNTQYFRFNGDSLGELKISKIIYDNQNDGNLKLNISNPDPQHSINATVNVYLNGNHTDNLIAIETREYQLKILESFLGTMFSDIDGYATGTLNIQGDLRNLNYVGKAHLHNAGLKLKFTQVYYRLRDGDLELKEHELDLGVLKLIDTLTNRTATLKGNIQHDSWKNMFFDLEAKVDDGPITLLNTTGADNTSFYGHAVGTGSMILVGPQTDMALVVDAKASEEDSSHITIPPAKSRAGSMADFLVERTHGHTIKDSLVLAPESKITYDIDLTADPHTTIEVVLDEMTGDKVVGKGRGSLNIHSGTTEPLAINGSYFIEEGSYLFTFQSFFKRPFELRKGGSNYIKWSGDPLNAAIHFDAMYKADNVSFAPLASSLGLDSKVQTIRDDVYVIVTMSGQLFEPTFEFKLEFPPSSIAINDPTLAFNLTQIENNPNEIQKQVTYLIVFNSFAPVGNQGGSTATSASSVIGTAINELAYNTISGLLFNEINKTFSNILAKVFKDDKLKVNISGSVYNRNLVQQNGNNFNINNINTNVNITVSRALFNDRFIITAGSTLDIPLQTSIEQKFQFLPDVTMEWLMNPSGTIRATFFYRENLDFITGTTNTTTAAKNKRTGAGIAYRKEFNHLSELFRHKGEKKKKEENNIVTPATPTSAQKPGEQKDSGNQ